MTKTGQATVFSSALAAALDGNYFPGRQVALRATRVPAAPRTLEALVTCEVWSDAPRGWARRAEIPIPATSAITLQDVEHAVREAGWQIVPAHDGRTRWRVDAGTAPTTYVLDVRHP